MTAVLSYLEAGINCFGETDNCMAGQKEKQTPCQAATHKILNHASNNIKEIKKNPARNNIKEPKNVQKKVKNWLFFLDHVTTFYTV